MSEKVQQEKNIYHVVNKNTGNRLYIAGVSPEEACASVHWPYEDCHVIEVPKQRHPLWFSDARIFVKLNIQICPYQRAECIKPEGTTCPVRIEVPDLNSWLKKVLLAHTCDHVGVDLTVNDYELHRKWMPLPQAIKELTPKP